MLKNKINIASAIALLLVLTITISLFALPNASAQFNYNAATQAAIDAGMNWDIPFNAGANRLYLWDRWQDNVPTHMFLVVSPNPVGVGQMVSVILMNPQVPPGAVAGNDIRWTYKATLTKPDGTIENYPPPGTAAPPGSQIQDGKYISDSTGSTFFTFTPAETGNYTITGTFQEMEFLWSDTATMRDYYGVTLLESSYTVKLEVQNELVVPSTWTPVPLPTEYWSRPIEGQNVEWHQIASNWLSGSHDQDLGGSQNRFQPHGIAPNTGHILWTKPMEDGGIVGGDMFNPTGEAFNMGHQYQTRMTNPIIMHGRLYYQLPLSTTARGEGGGASSGGGGGWMCVDLRTGQELWYNSDIGAPNSGIPNIAFGYYYDQDWMNDHGVCINKLFSGNFGTAFNPLTGQPYRFNLVDVPSGEELIGQQGEQIRYNIYNAGTTANPEWRLRQWNSSNIIHMRMQKTGDINASSPTAFDWDVPIPWRTGMSAATTRGAMLGDLLLGSNGTHPAAPAYHVPREVTFWAVSLKPGDEGRLMWMKNYITSTDDNQNLLFRRAAEGVFVFARTPYMSWVGYDMYTGNLLWETASQANFNPFGYYGTASGYRVYENSIAYGTLFTAGYSGRVAAYNLTTGTLMWDYIAPTGQSIFPYYTMMIGAIADGKIYLGTHEHSAQTPLFKGNLIRCLDVVTGEELWTHYGWANPQTMAIADGTLVYRSDYDGQIYAIGKGPSATTVTVSPKVSINGASVLIEGMVTDISAGTKQETQVARFPNGLPAVSDSSMKGWMEYVYMQKPHPTDVTGVPMTISVVDANGNYREIGLVTSNSDGFFSLSWTPDIEGKYTVYANFAGSESYWPSHAVTAFTVDSAPTTPAPTQAITPTSAADTYLLPGIIAIIVAIAIVGAILSILMLKKRP
jgi:hypothetical protein